MLRSLMLSLAENNRIGGWVRRQGMVVGFARRFVAGEELAEAIGAVRRLNEAGILGSLDFLGESVRDAPEARKAAHRYLEMLDAIAASGIQCDVSLKLTQLGLDINALIAEENMRQIVGLARTLANFVRIDMESSAYTERTLQMFGRLQQEFDGSVGAVIQSYLCRSAADVEQLLRLKANVRLCKGAYKEPPGVAFQAKTDVDRNFVALLEKLLLRGGYTAIATHDEAMIRRAGEFIRQNKISRDRFEFQMLYGVRRDLQLALARQGHRMRVYVPFGKQWYPYFMRRMAERPANLWFVVKNLFKG
ncbi:MAG: proline dehydrogenase family protein [Acidobacteria bacterium]|nr:proline dehydrogenase family protein [Acidobacteriota bacterium]